MPKAKADIDIEAVRARRLVLKDILNSNLLTPGAREKFEKEYEETGADLLAAIGMTAEEAAKHGLQ